ncbi:hypothetical protein [Paraburkholderia sp. BCC1885]|uniref:hypothetical protein n=1 Tax=Paraburkholderia sp. BCC1885 TaxID=2562669 RepID=UPI00118362BC|nr:hypothetical protein [Paraburkholderia sp. BCC1885]
MNAQTEKAFWLVWSPTGVRPPKYRHATERSAVTEAERLAREHRGQLFVVLEATVARRVDDMQRTTFTRDSRDEIPF